MPRLRLFAILCFDSQERREAPRLVYRLDTRGAGLYRRQPVTVPPVPCHLRFTRQRHPPRQVTLPPPYPFSRPAAQRVIEVPALHLWFAVLYPRVEHQAVLAVVVVVVGPLVVHPYHPFRDAVRLLRQPAVFIVAVDIVRIFRDAVTACARVAINLSSPPKQISALTTLSHQQEAEIRQLERELRIGLRTDTSRMPGLPEMKVEVRSLTENPPQASVIKQGSTVRGFIAGIACSVAVASALWWWQVYPVQQQLLQVNDTAQGAATVWMASPELENYERRLQQLLDTSPVQPLETGMQMMRVADSRWPESLQQQQASTQWNEALKTRAQSSPQLRGWLQTRQDLHAFADLVMQREKEGLTLSYIKNVIWQAERGLGQETPVESLLTQYHDARAQKQNTDALEKQINERLEGVLSRWLLLKNNVMPEAATGTTAEK